MFSFVAVFRGTIKTTASATGWAILFSLLIMSIILMLVIIIITLVIGPTTTASSYLLRTPAMALSSSLLVDFPGNRVCGGYCIDYGYSDMCLSETYSSGIGIDYTEVFGLCFSV